MIKKSNDVNLIIIFFFLFFIVGINIFDDYLVTPDEPLHRINGFISLKYIFDFFSIDYNLEIFKNIPDLYSDWRKTYGTVFDLPLSALELFLNLQPPTAFLIRHFLTFFIFFIACIYFFSLIKINLNNEKLGILGVGMLFTTCWFC